MSEANDEPPPKLFRVTITNPPADPDSSSELINIKPGLKYKTNKLNLPFKTTFNTTSFAGKIEEITQKKITGKTAHIITKIKKNTPLTHTLSLDTSLTNRYHYYNNNPNWTQLFLANTFKLNNSLSPSIGLNVPLYKKNNSPFNFEKKYLAQNTEIILGIHYKSNNYTITPTLFYDSKEKKIRDLSINIAKTFHCWIIGLKWNKAQEEFKINFKIY